MNMCVKHLKAMLITGITTKPYPWWDEFFFRQVLNCNSYPIVTDSRSRSLKENKFPMENALYPEIDADSGNVVSG